MTRQIDRLRALIAWLLEADALPAGGPLERVLEEALAAYRGDITRFSDILEFSAQTSAAQPTDAQTRLSTYARFSYAFPGYRDDFNHAQSSFARIAASAGLGDVAPRLMRVAKHPSVQQPIVGLAMDDPSTPRPKVYLQFHQGASDAARGVAAALLTRDLRELPPGALHMLGLDFNASGALSGAKLYMHAGDAPATIPAALVRDGLHIHRLSTPDGSFASETFDFALASEADWPSLQREVPVFTAFRALEEAFEIRVRRASLSTDGRVTAYYVLR